MRQINGFRETDEWTEYEKQVYVNINGKIQLMSKGSL